MKVPVPIRCIRVVTEAIDAAYPNDNRSELILAAFEEFFQTRPPLREMTPLAGMSQDHKFTILLPPVMKGQLDCFCAATLYSQSQAFMAIIWAVLAQRGVLKPTPTPLEG